MGKARRREVSRSQVLLTVGQMAAHAFRVSEDAAAKGRSGEAARYLAVAIFLRDLAESRSVYIFPRLSDFPSDN